MVSEVSWGKSSKVTLWAICPLLSHSMTWPALSVEEAGLNLSWSVSLTVVAAVWPWTTWPGPLATGPAGVALAAELGPGVITGIVAPDADLARSAVGVATLGEIASDAPHATSSRALAPTTAGASPRCLRRRTTIKATPPEGLHCISKSRPEC